MDRLIEEIDLTDWGDEIRRAEPDMVTFEGAVEEQMANGRSPQQMGRFAVAGRLLGIAGAGLIPPTKALVQTGAARCWTERLMRQKRIVEMEDGREIRVRKFVGPVAEGDESATGRWIESDDPAAVGRAERYLRTAVPGFIRSRLNIIAFNGGDVKAAGAELRREITAMVKALT